MTAIYGAFGQRDGMAVIKATNAYLNQLAASDRDKATALAAFINEDPMMVCSLGLEVPGVTMPIRWLVGDGTAYINTGVTPYTGIIMKASMATLYDYWTAFGSRVNYQDKMCSVSINTAAGEKRILVDIASVRTTINMSYQQGDEIKIEVNDVVHKATIWGTQYNIPNVVANNVNICVFALNNNGSMMNNYASKYREFEIVGLREYLPMKLGKAWAAEDVSTGVAQAAGTCGMIDLVSGKFFTNANSQGSFTIPDISYTPPTP